LRLHPRSLLLIAALTGCTGNLIGDPSTAPDDVGQSLADVVDVGTAPRDVGTAPRDAGTPRLDAGTPPRDVGTSPRDAGTQRPDVGTPPRDVGTPSVDIPLPSMCAGGPLATPLAGCRPAVLPSTGDPAQDCVNRINQFRRECQCLPPLQRWTDGEACADRQAMIDHQTMTAHNGFRMGVCSSGGGQNECPGWLGWGSVESTISGCLQQMWDEGPGDFYGPPPHGHYINMSSTRFSRVACGYFISGGGATTAVQNFQ
jgi:hypothetical protein